MTYELKDYLNAINHEKKNLMDTDDEMWEKKYPDKKLQFDFLLNSVRTRKRYVPWMKAKKLKNIECVKEYYGYNNEKAKSALNLLNDEQIKTIKDSLNKGGKNGKR